MSDQTILLVDDDPSILATMSHVLEPDYRVRAANSGERALQVAVTPPHPDLILLDVLMAGMDGYTVLEKLKQNPQLKEVPVIFVTAMETESDEEKGLALGATDYITKPISPPILLARVKTHLALKQARDFLHDKNAYLEAEIESRMEENQIIQNVSIRALAHLAETRDPETGDHILRTQSYIRLLAENLRDHPRFSATINNRFIELLAKSAPLHDIGKVGIPDQILLKNGKLTKDEWVIMQTHAELGARAIEKSEKDVDRPVEFLALAKEIAHWHHERWDGNGYPDGMQGEEIPVSARLMAVADVFDAVISRRVYKPPMPYEKARELIEAGRGTQFDPDVTDAFLNNFREFVSIAQKYQDGTVTMSATG